MSTSTELLDHKKRRIHVKIKHNGKSVFFVKKSDGTRLYGNKAMFRKHGAKGKVKKVANAKSVPVGIRSTNMLPRNEAMIHNLAMWHKRLFENFGLMILAKARGKGYKVKDYKRSIKEFLKSAEKSKRRLDVKILMRQVRTLKAHAKML